MEDARIRAFSRSLGSNIRTLALPLLIGAALYAMAQPAKAANCQAGSVPGGDGVLTAGDDTCVITSASDQTTAVDGDAGTDELHLEASAADLVFDTSTIGTVFLNFETVHVATGGGFDVTLTGTASNSLSWLVDGTLNVAGTNNIGDLSAVTISGIGVMHLTTDNETIGSLAAASATAELHLDVADKMLTTGGNNASTTFAGVISGLGGLTKAGTGTFTLTNDNSYTGLTAVTGGTLEISHAGAIDDSSAVSVTSTGSLTGTVAYSVTSLTNHGFVAGNLTATGAVANSGTLSPGIGTGAIGTMDFNSTYTTGMGTGRAEMDVNLLTGVHDFVHVAGAAGGATYLDINQLNAPNTGVATTGHGIFLWQMDGVSSLGFALENPVLSGPYQYLLNYVPDFAGTTDGLFLQSALRDEFYGNVALLSGGQAIIRSCFRSDQRIPDAPRGRDNVRFWGGGANASFKTKTDSGVAMEDQMYCATGGLDVGVGDGIRFGVVGGFGNSTIEVETPAGFADLDGSTQAIEALLAIGNSRYFFNVTGGYATTSWTFEDAATGLPSQDVTQRGLIGSAQAGATVNMTPFRFKFIGAVNYDQTRCGDDCLLAGTTEDTGILEAKGTIRVEAMTRDINPYVAVSFTDDISGENTVSFAGESLSANPGHSLLALNAGFHAPIDDGIVIYGDFEVIDGIGNETSGYTAGAGFKAFW
jgi:autotransporter-associated beta strand protein